MRQHIKITDEHIVIDKKNIKWCDIIGVRKFDDNLLRQIGTRFQFSEIFIKGGKVIKIRSRISLEGLEARNYSEEYKNKFKDYFTVIDMISEKGNNIKHDLSSWREWRLLLPTVLSEIIFMIYAILNHKNLDEMIILMLSIGIASLPIGWIWEHQARKEKWK